MKHSSSRNKIDQSIYFTSILKSYGLWNFYPLATPLNTNISSLNFVIDEDYILRPIDHTAYREIGGGLMYISVSKRQDIAFSVGSLTRQMRVTTIQNLKISKRVLQYLSETADLWIIYPRRGTVTEKYIVAAVEADWVGDKDTRR